jgi:hypothetical protein
VSERTQQDAGALVRELEAIRWTEVTDDSPPPLAGVHSERGDDRWLLSRGAHLTFQVMTGFGDERWVSVDLFTAEVDREDDSAADRLRALWRAGFEHGVAQVTKWFGPPTRLLDARQASDEELHESVRLAIWERAAGTTKVSQWAVDERELVQVKLVFEPRRGAPPGAP